MSLGGNIFPHGSAQPGTIGPASPLLRQVEVPEKGRKFAGTAMLDRLEGLLCFLSYMTTCAQSEPPGEVTVVRRNENRNMYR